MLFAKPPLIYNKPASIFLILHKSKWPQLAEEQPEQETHDTTSGPHLVQ
jgi:hypothetical protein